MNGMRNGSVRSFFPPSAVPSHAVSLRRRYGPSFVSHVPLSDRSCRRRMIIRREPHHIAGFSGSLLSPPYSRLSPLARHSLGSLACGSVPRSYLTQSLPLHSSPSDRPGAGSFGPPSDGEEWKEGKETAGIDLLSLRSLPGW